MGNLKFNNVYIKNFYTIAGPKEKDSKISNVNLKFDDLYFGKQTFEDAEIKMQEVSIQNLLNNERLSENKIDYVFATDLINQLGVSSQTMSNFNIPFVGVYAACAGFPLQILLGSNLIESKNAKNIITLASSHNLTAERQFRYPTEYGCPKKGTATCTLTACVSMLLTNEKTNIKVSGGLIGKVVNLGINDVNNMGAVMAPACADTIYTYLQNAHETVKDYDLILTGDLGKVGLNILKEYYEKVYNEIKDINFINRTTNIINNKMVTYEELGRINLDLINKFSVDNVLKKYVNILLTSNSIYMPNLISLYSEIKKLLENAQLKNCYFHKERLVYNLVDTYVNKFSGLNDISIISTNTNLVYELYDLTTYRMNLIKEGEK